MRLSVLIVIGRDFVLITSGCVRSPRRYILTETPASALRWREDQANLAAQALQVGVNVSLTCEATYRRRSSSQKVTLADGIRLARPWSTAQHPRLTPPRRDPRAVTSLASGHTREQQ